MTSYVPLDKYRSVPISGYQSFRFFKSLFPLYIKGMPSADSKIPVMKLQCLESTVAFREASQTLLNSVLNGSYVEEIVDVPRTRFNSYTSTLAPPDFHDITPVLYHQIVATEYPTGVVLEAKDFFVMCPDRRDLHCIILDHHSVNIVSSCGGFDKALLSVKDLVWVYRVTPSRTALQNPAQILERSRIPRVVAIDHAIPFFWRVSHFALITPHVCHDYGLGVVVDLIERHGRIQKFRAVFEGAPEAVTVPPFVCASDLDPVTEFSILRARSRSNVSSAIRFSESPVFYDARLQLYEFAQKFLPVNNNEASCRSRSLTYDLRTWTGCTIELRISRTTSKTLQLQNGRWANFSMFVVLH